MINKLGDYLSNKIIVHAEKKFTYFGKTSHVCKNGGLRIADAISGGLHKSGQSALYIRESYS